MGAGVVGDFSMVPIPSAVFVALPDGTCSKDVGEIDAEISGDSAILGRPGP